MFALVFLCVLPLETSFLIDVSTPIPPKAGTFITDEHYNLLMDFVMQERKSRQNLEKYVIQLNQRMTIMAKDVASTKTKVGVLEKANSNADLQEVFDGLKNSSEIMKQAYDKLLLEHSNLKSEVNVVTQRNNKLQIEVDSLKQLKTILPLQTLANMNNFTVHLEKEIQSTNSIVNKVLSDGNARKQDFIALMNVTNVLKTRLSDTQLYLDQKFKDIEMKIKLTETSDHECESKMDNLNQTFTARANGIENRLNTNVRNLTATSQSTNSMVNKVLSNRNARKQDFIALMNVTNVLKTRLSDTQLFLDKKFKDIEIKQNLTETSDHEFESKMDKINQTLTTKANGIENRISANIRQLAAKSQSISNILKTKLSEAKLFVEKKLNDIEIKYNLTTTANVNELENRMNTNIHNLTVTSQAIMVKLTENNRRGKYVIWLVVDKSFEPLKFQQYLKTKQKCEKGSENRDDDFWIPLGDYRVLGWDENLVFSSSCNVPTFLIFFSRNS